MAELPVPAVSFERKSPLLLKATVKDKRTGDCLVEFNGTEHQQEDTTTSADKSNVLQRRVFNVSFDSEKAQIYDKTAIILASGSATNSTQAETDLMFEVSYGDTSSSTFTNSMPISAPVPVNSEISTAFPRIMEGGNTVKIPTDELTKPFEWNLAIVETNPVQTVNLLVVPPMTHLRFNMVLKGATCSIPFSYTQTDDNVATQYDDGVYIGSNNYGFEIENDHIPI